MSNQSIVLTDTEIKVNLLKNNQIVARFPFLKGVKAKVDAVGSCAPCQRGAKGEAANLAVSDAKAQLAKMSQPDKEALKQLLGVQEVRIYYIATVNGKTVRERVTF